jgi:hypothetical protein
MAQDTSVKFGQGFTWRGSQIRDTDLLSGVVLVCQRAATCIDRGALRVRVRNYPIRQI